MIPDLLYLKALINKILAKISKLPGKYPVVFQLYHQDYLVHTVWTIKFVLQKSLIAVSLDSLVALQEDLNKLLLNNNCCDCRSCIDINALLLILAPIFVDDPWLG